jgi:MoxR-like ATPase
MMGGECEQCGVQFRNADSHNGDCPVEAQLHDMHSVQGNGSASCAPLCECIDPLLLQQIIAMVAHGEFDPVFRDIEKAFGMVSNEIIQSAKSATKGKQDILEALKAVKEMKRKRASTAEKLVIEFPHAPPVALTTQHPVIFPQVMALMCLPDNIRQPVLLFGEAGAGKSTLWEQVAMALDLFENDYSAMSMAGDTTSGKINGRILPVGEGIYVPSELVRRLLLERPFLFVFDEYDAPSPEIQVGMHTFLANDAIYVEERSFAKEPVRIPKPRGTRVGAACNTNLAGGTGRYQGRQAQDGATRDRWLCLKVMENPAIAAGICGVSYDPLPTWLPQEYSEESLRAMLAIAHKWYLDTQKAVAAKKVPQLVTPRALLRARACLMAGFTWLETRKVLLAGWKQDELDQIGETEIRAY